jgi:hypothetical protein
MSVREDRRKYTTPEYVAVLLIQYCLCPNTLSAQMNVHNQLSQLLTIVADKYLASCRLREYIRGIWRQFDVLLETRVTFILQNQLLARELK